jgi:SanA protein
MRVTAGRKFLRAIPIAVALAALAPAGVAGTNAWVAHATAGRAYASVETVPSRDVAIVPGARVYNGKPFVHLEARLKTALMLYQGGRVKKILVSGTDTAEAPEASVMSSWLRERGVDPADIMVDAGGSRTRETMNRAADVFDVRDAVVCTQDVNAARSVYLAEQAGIDAVAVAAPSDLGRSARYMRREALKTALAFFESILRPVSDAVAAERARRMAIAAR